MGKRKRELGEHLNSSIAPEKNAEKRTSPNEREHCDAPLAVVQIIVGTYEKTLHGIQATVWKQTSGDTEFADTFLLSPHSSAIRCLAISPPSSSDTIKKQKAILASGGSDQIINLYHISREAPRRQRVKGPLLPTLSKKNVAENPNNRELGSLHHHSGSINALYFPTRSKLLSSAEDNTISVARTKDWTVLSTIKAPIPKAHGRPSGDTAPLAGIPSGVNDFAIHPSMKLMVSVSKGEKCMRLWNLVTGKKAGVLNFDRDLLYDIGESKWASGEGRKVEWNHVGEEFAVGFERGCLVFGLDCKPKCRMVPSPPTKVHQLRYATVSTNNNDSEEIVAVSTEDGRIIFYWTCVPVNVEADPPTGKRSIPLGKAIGQIGGARQGLTGRMKDFEILDLQDLATLIIVTGSSDGAIRLWIVDKADFHGKKLNHETSSITSLDASSNGEKTEALNKVVQTTSMVQMGQLLGTFEAGNRITCLKAFIMSQCEHSEPSGLNIYTEGLTSNGTNIEDESNVRS